MCLHVSVCSSSSPPCLCGFGQTSPTHKHTWVVFLATLLLDHVCLTTVCLRPTYNVCVCVCLCVCVCVCERERERESAPQTDRTTIMASIYPPCCISGSMRVRTLTFQSLCFSEFVQEKVVVAAETPTQGQKGSKQTRQKKADTIR